MGKPGWSSTRDRKFCFAALHSRKDIQFLSLVEDHPVFHKNVCKNLLISEFAGKISIGLQLGGASLETRNLSLGVRSFMSLVLCVVLCRPLFVFFFFFCPSSTYGFWLLLWYSQTFRVQSNNWLVNQQN